MDGNGSVHMVSTPSMESWMIMTWNCQAKEGEEEQCMWLTHETKKKKSSVRNSCLLNKSLLFSPSDWMRFQAQVIVMYFWKTNVGLQLWFIFQKRMLNCY